MTLELVPNEDILKAVRARFQALAIIGFAAETSAHEEYAREKLRVKGLQAIVLNDVSRKDIGFDADKNGGSILSADGGRIELPEESKFNMARRILTAAISHLQ